MKHWTLQLAEFFFTNFWHWLGLVLLVSSVSGIISIKYNRSRETSERSR